MSQHYIFNQAGVVPGLAEGDFAGVRVDIDDQGEVTAQPLARHPHFLAAREEEKVAGKKEGEKQTRSEAAPAQEDQGEVPPEQPTSPPVEPSPEAAASEQA